MRSPRWDSNGVKKGSWSPDEDQKLTDYINRYGIWNWNLMPKYAGLSRNGKSCRLRWVNYLNPQSKRGNITKEEEHTIFTLYEKLGKKWSVIAKNLPGRTDNEIKNYWHTHSKKRLKQRTVPQTQSDQECLTDSKIISSDESSKELLTNSCFCSVTSSSHSTCSSSIEVTDHGNFWSQPFLYESNEEESHIQEWYHGQEPLSPYALYNNEYYFSHLPETESDGWT